MRAILAPYDKSGLVPFAEGLAALGWELFSTGNTFRLLTGAGVAVRPVQDLTGFPEILDGRVKTLHPGVHGGLLARRDRPEHLAELAEHGLVPIDLLAGGLYPFRETVQSGAALPEVLEQIDIGGPAMIRASAKNFPGVLTVVDPADYEPLLAALRAGDVPLQQRRRLAAKAFQHVAAYDTAVAEYLRGDDPFPSVVSHAFEKLNDLRYGENPHQRGAVYRSLSIAPDAASGVATAELLHGLPMSFVNYVDADGAWDAVWDFEGPACVIVKHAIPCGLATGEDIVAVYEQALAGDPVSAFGGIIAFNREVDARLATALREVRNPLSGMRQRFDVLAAPGFTDDGLAIIRGKSKDLRILRAAPPRLGGQRIREVSGGLLVHDADTFTPEEFGFRTVSKRQPTEEERRALAFAWRVCKHIKSNAIVLASVRR